MKKSLLRTLALSVAAAAALTGSVALGQQPQPAQRQPIQLPGGHPALPGQAPGRPPVIIGPDGRPRAVPGQPGMPGMPTRPGQNGRTLPPGFNPHARPHAPEPAEEEHGGGEHEECPGHGPDDAPPPINLWHGMLMANTEQADKGGFVNQLLFRHWNDHDHCDPKNEPPPFLASVLNFAILAFIIGRYGKKPLAEALGSRKKEIMAEIDAAQTLLDAAQGRIDDYTEKLENVEGRRAELRADAATQAEEEKKRILSEAEERRTRMRRDAEFRIEQERKAVRDELLAEAVLAAAAAAEDLIKKQVTSSDNDRMAADYLRSIAPALKSGAKEARS